MPNIINAIAWKNCMETDCRESENRLVDHFTSDAHVDVACMGETCVTVHVVIKVCVYYFFSIYKIRIG